MAVSKQARGWVALAITLVLGVWIFHYYALLAALTVAVAVLVGLATHTSSRRVRWILLTAAALLVALPALAYVELAGYQELTLIR